MKIDLGAGEFWLAENRPLPLRQAAGWCVRCTAGRVWITVAGESEDIFLAAGESYRIPGDGLVLVEALGDGRVRVNPERPGAVARLSSLAADFSRALNLPLFR